MGEKKQKNLWIHGTRYDSEKQVGGILGGGLLLVFSFAFLIIGLFSIIVSTTLGIVLIILSLFGFFYGYKISKKHKLRPR